VRPKGPPNCRGTRSRGSGSGEIDEVQLLGEEELLDIDASSSEAELWLSLDCSGLKSNSSWDIQVTSEARCYGAES